MEDKRFPAELLNKGKNERIEYFEELTVAHPNLSQAFEELWQAVNYSKPGTVILVFGPTGVGKTTLMNHLTKKITEDMYEELQSDSSIIPCVNVEATMPLKGNFDWKELFRDMLEILSEPVSLETAIRKKNLSDPMLKKVLTKDSNSSASKFRYAVEKWLMYRMTRVVSIDEGQHLTVLASARKLLDQPNTVKSIANRTETTHVLYGTYDLLLLRNLNGQLSRRTHDIYFRQYDFEKEDELKAFRNTLWMFQNQIPVKKTPDLLSIWEYLFERSLGCVGILKEWLDRALKLMFDEDDEVFQIQYLEKTALSMVKCQKIATEISEAEAKLLLEKEEFEDLRTLLKMDKSALKKEDNTETKDKKKEKGVGARNPKRDPIGKK